MNPYTVILLYPDYIANTYGHDTYMAEVLAENVDDAITEAWLEACSENVFDEEENPQEDWHVVAVIAGHHKDIKP